MEQPLVSVGLLTYKHEKYIADALKGIISQDYKNIELIMLDDASPDGTFQAMEPYLHLLESQFVRVVRLQNEVNTGSIPHNVNLIYRQAKGDFIHVIAGDDVMLPHCESTLVETLCQHEDCIMAFGNMIMVPDAYSYGKKIESFALWRPNELPSCRMKEDLFQRLMYNCIVSAPTAMIRRRAIEEYGEHDETLPVEDYEYWLRLSRQEAFYFVNKHLVLYRRAQESYTNFDSPRAYERILSMIDSDYRTKKKYLHYLDEEKRIDCMKDFVAMYTGLCVETNHREGLEKLYDIMTEEGISLDDF